MVLGGFWEAENIDFRIFSDVFSKPNLSCVSDKPKIAKKRANHGADAFLERGSGGREAPGEKQKEGL